MANRNPRSKLWLPSCIETKEAFESEMEKSWDKYSTRIKDFQSSEGQGIIASLAATEDFKPLTMGLLYGILTAKPNDGDGRKKELMNALMWASSGGPSDAWNHILTNVNFIIVEWWDRLAQGVRQNFVWLLDSAIALSVPNMDDVLTRMLRNLKGGDVSPMALQLADMLHALIEKHLEWVKSTRKGLLISTIVSTYLRLLCDHVTGPTQALRKKEAKLCAVLLRERFPECQMMGRELGRFLLMTGRCPELDSLMADLLHNPAALAPGFTGLAELLEAKPNKRIVISRISMSLERELDFVLKKVRAGPQYSGRHIHWLLGKHLGAGAERAGSLRWDILRWLCLVPEPSYPDFVSKHTLISAFLPNTASNVTESQYSKLVLFWDWLFFNGSTNPAALEPAYSLMWQSMKGQNSNLHIHNEIYPPLKDKIRQNLVAAFKILPNYPQLLEGSRLDSRLRARIALSFPELVKAGTSASALDGSSVKEELAMSILEESEEGEETGKFSDDDESGKKSLTVSMGLDEEDDGDEEMKEEVIPAPVERKPQPPARPSNEDQGEEVDLEKGLGGVDESLKPVLLAMESSRDNADRADHIQKLLLLFLNDEDEIHSDEAQIESLAVCLCAILQRDFGKRRLAPANLHDLNALQDSLAAPIFALFRNLVLSPNDDASWVAIIRLVGEMQVRQNKVGYYLLYFLFASSQCGEADGRGLVGDATPYKSLCEYLDRPIKACLVTDLELCCIDDYQLFGALIPFVFQSLKTDAMSSPELVHLIVANIDPIQMKELIGSIVQGSLTFFKKDSFTEILKWSLEWESVEQMFLWDLIAAEGVPFDWVLPLIPKVEEERHAEAMTSILLLLKRMDKEPNTGLVRALLCRPLPSSSPKPASPPLVLLTTLGLKVLIDEWEDKMGEIVTSLVSKMRSKKSSGVGKGLTLELILSHLDRLRKDCPRLINNPDDEFFARGELQKVLGEVRESLPAVQAQFAEFFAAMELLESVRDPSYFRKSRSATNAKALHNDSSDDEAAKARPPKKKRKKVVESDSD